MFTNTYKIMKTKITLLLSLILAFICQGQTIEKFSIDSGGANATAGGIEILYTIGEVNVQELSAGNIQVSDDTKKMMESLFNSFMGK